MWVISDICCSCILYPVYLPFFTAPSRWVNSSFLARGLKGWKALQTAWKVHIQAAYLVFWHILLSLLQNSLQLQKYMSMFFFIASLPAPQLHQMKWWCSLELCLNWKTVLLEVTVPPSINHLRKKYSPPVRELIANNPGGGAKPYLEKTKCLMPTN